MTAPQQAATIPTMAPTDSPLSPVSGLKSAHENVRNYDVVINKKNRKESGREKLLRITWCHCNS